MDASLIIVLCCDFLLFTTAYFARDRPLKDPYMLAMSISLITVLVFFSYRAFKEDHSSWDRDAHLEMRELTPNERSKGFSLIGGMIADNIISAGIEHLANGETADPRIKEMIPKMKETVRKTHLSAIGTFLDSLVNKEPEEVAP